MLSLHGFGPLATHLCALRNHKIIRVLLKDSQRKPSSVLKQTPVSKLVLLYASSSKDKKRACTLGGCAECNTRPLQL